MSKRTIKSVKMQLKPQKFNEDSKLYFYKTKTEKKTQEIDLNKWLESINCWDLLETCKFL